MTCLKSSDCESGVPRLCRSFSSFFFAVSALGVNLRGSASFRCLGRFLVFDMISAVKLLLRRLEKLWLVFAFGRLVFAWPAHRAG